VVHQIAVIGSCFGALSGVCELHKREAPADINLVASPAELYDLLASSGL